MLRKQAAFFLLFLMVGMIAQSAIHHASAHDEIQSACEYCLVADQLQPLDLTVEQSFAHDRMHHSVFIYEECLQDIAFAKARFNTNQLSIRPPPARI